MLDIDYKNYSFLISKLRKNVLSYKHRDQDMPEVVTSGSHSHFDFEIDQNLLSVEFTNQFSTTECIAMQAKRFHWINNTHFEVVNKAGVSLRVQLIDPVAKIDLQRRAALKKIEFDESIKFHLELS